MTRPIWERSQAGQNEDNPRSAEDAGESPLRAKQSTCAWLQKAKSKKEVTSSDFSITYTFQYIAIVLIILWTRQDEAEWQCKPVMENCEYFFENIWGFFLCQKNCSTQKCIFCQKACQCNPFYKHFRVEQKVAKMAVAGRGRIRQYLAECGSGRSGSGRKSQEGHDQGCNSIGLSFDFIIVCFPRCTCVL